MTQYLRNSSIKSLTLICNWTRPGRAGSSPKGRVRLVANPAPSHTVVLFSPRTLMCYKLQTRAPPKCSVSGQNCCFSSSSPSHAASYPSVSHISAAVRRFKLSALNSLLAGKKKKKPWRGIFTHLCTAAGNVLQRSLNLHAWPFVRNLLHDLAF